MPKKSDSVGTRFMGRTGGRKPPPRRGRYMRGGEAMKKAHEDAKKRVVPGEDDFDEVD